jgi:hypothetical protein
MISRLLRQILRTISWCHSKPKKNWAVALNLGFRYLYSGPTPMTDLGGHGQAKINAKKTSYLLTRRPTRQGRVRQDEVRNVELVIAMIGVPGCTVSGRHYFSLTIIVLATTSDGVQ